MLRRQNCRAHRSKLNLPASYRTDLINVCHIFCSSVHRDETVALSLAQRDSHPATMFSSSLRVPLPLETRNCATRTSSVSFQIHTVTRDAERLRPRWIVRVILITSDREVTQKLHANTSRPGVLFAPWGNWLVLVDGYIFNQ